MNKKLIKAAVTAAISLAVSAPAFANPFVDVPATHWAYDAVSQLSKAGIVAGFNDNTFKGERVMTRYEMAQIIANLLQQKNLSNDQKVVVDKLAKEFSSELSSLNVKVNNVQDQLDKAVKISGDARVRYFNTDSDTVKDSTDYRARISFDGKINDALKFNARLSSGNQNSEDIAKGAVRLDTANVSFNALGLSNTVGRQDVKLGGGFLMDTQMNGLTSQIGGLKAFAGNATQTKDGTQWDRSYGAEYVTTILGANVAADYAKIAGETYYGVNASRDLAKGLAGTAQYFKNDDQDATAQAYGLKLTNYGLSATYRDVEAKALTAFSTLNLDANNSALANGFKGMEYQYDRNLGKNAALTVKYQDFEQQDGTKVDARTSAVVNVKF